MTSASRIDGIEDIRGKYPDNAATLPPRSLLYSLEAVGVGTPLVESFTTYVMRLARAHRLSVVDIAAIAMTSERNASPAMRPTLVWAVAFNGATVRGERWVRAFEQATNYPKLRFLTLHPLHSAFSQGVLSTHRAWCSSCLEEWRSKRMTVYEPLLWSFKLVRVCPVHNRLLERTCPHCRRRFVALATLSYPGVCQYCHCWLATPDKCLDMKSPGDSCDLSVSKAIGGMLELLPIVDSKRIRHTIVRNISSCIQRLGGGNLAAFTKHLPEINEAILREGLAGRQLLQLHTLIRISNGLGIPLARFFNPTRFSAEDIATAMKSTSTLRQMGCQRPCRAAEIRATLVRVIRGHERPSLQQVACQLGYTSPDMLRKTDRRLCQVINKRHAESHRHENQSEHCSRIRQNLFLYKMALENALESAELFSPFTVARNCGYSGSQLGSIFPDLWTAVVSKARENKQRHHTEIHKKLEEALSEDPAPSLWALSRRLGCSPEFLRNREPELRNLLGERHKRTQMKRLEIIEKQVMLRLAEDPPPSATEVCCSLGISNQSLTRYLPAIQEKLTRRRKEWVQGKIQRRHEAVFQEAREIALRLHKPGVITPMSQIQRLLSPSNMPNWNILTEILSEARDSAVNGRY